MWKMPRFISVCVLISAIGTALSIGFTIDGLLTVDITDDSEKYGGPPSIGTDDMMFLTGTYCVLCGVY